MRKIFISISLFFIFIVSSFAQNYSDFFSNDACRVDFTLCGNKTQTSAFLSNIIHEPFWGGRRSHLSNDMNLGQYRYQIADSASNNVIFTDEISTLYEEWQSTPEALNVNKSFEQTIQFPFPQRTVKLMIEKRTGFDTWERLLNFYINPEDKLIKTSKPPIAQVREIRKTVKPENALDIVVIAEGYQANQMDKFFEDASRLADQICSHEPFKTFKNRINVYAIGAISVDSGISMPQKGDWRNTAVGSHFYTFYSDRYLTTTNVFKLRDYASLVPYDAIYIMANTKTYGGGGIFNFYALASADSQRAQAEVVVHEFGHSFAGLADEYFYDTDVLDGMYSTKEEPWEPNITTLVKFETKWEKDLPADIQIPTPVTSESKTKIGVFEGGGYLKKSIYRPWYDCRMRTNTAKGFCSVCENAVIKRIKFITE
jgi:hypothetical protein